MALKRTQLHLGGDLGWECPRNKDGWHVQEMRQFLQALKHLGVYHEANIHGCAYGLDTQKANYFKKPWQVVLTSQMMAIKCSGTKMPRSRSHDECLGGTDAPNSGFYPQQMCNQISRKDMIAYRAFPSDTLTEDPTKTYKPLTEKEKQSSLRLLEKLHRRTGHPSNNALSRMLEHRGALPELIELARKHVCPDCQELRLAPLNPKTSLERSETLWETIVLDNAEFPIDGKVLH